MRYGIGANKAYNEARNGFYNKVGGKINKIRGNGVAEEDIGMGKRCNMLKPKKQYKKSTVYDNVGKERK